MGICTVKSGRGAMRISRGNVIQRGWADPPPFPPIGFEWTADIVVHIFAFMHTGRGPPIMQIWKGIRYYSSFFFMREISSVHRTKLTREGRGEVKGEMSFF